MLLQMALFHFLWPSNILLHTPTHTHLLYPFVCQWTLRRLLPVSAFVDSGAMNLGIHTPSLTHTHPFLLGDTHTSFNTHTHPFFIHSSVSGLLGGCFHVSAVVDRAAMNLRVHVFSNYSFLWICPKNEPCFS